jgi:N-acetylneuraminate synthase
MSMMKSTNTAKNLKIDWFASAWDVKSLEFLDNYDLKYHKIASAMIVDKNLLKSVAERGKHTFISTGMSTERGYR